MPNRIRELRRCKGLSQADLAERMGTNPQNISRWEKSQRRLDEKTLRLAAAALETSAASILDTPVENPQIVSEPSQLERSGDQGGLGDIIEHLSPAVRLAAVDLLGAAFRFARVVGQANDIRRHRKRAPNNFHHSGEKTLAVSSPLWLDALRCPRRAPYGPHPFSTLSQASG